MLSENIFKENLAILSINFQFKMRLSDECDQIYAKMVYDELKNSISDEMMKKTTTQILKETTLEEWNKTYGFGGKPALADWLNAYVPKPVLKKVKQYRLDENGKPTGIFDWITVVETNQQLLENN